MNSHILKNINDAIVVVNPQGIIEDASDSINDLFLYDKGELIGAPLSMLLPERFRESHDKIFIGLLNNPIQRRMGEGKGMKFLALAKDGNEFYIDIALSFYETEDKKVHYVAVIRDISDLIKIQKDLEKTVEELDIKNKELEHFAYIVSHDLKAPARSTRQLIEFIEEDHKDELSGDVLEFFKLIKDSNKRMSELIDGILSYSRAGEVETEKTTFNLNELLTEITASLQIPKGFKITLTNCDLSIFAQQTQISQVLTNIIGNSIKYHDKKTGLINVSCAKTIDEIEIKIKDDGPGIPEKYHRTIFEMFGTANETKRDDSTGIGLAIVKKIVEQNGGKIVLNSELGKGSEFIFTWKTL